MSLDDQAAPFGAGPFEARFTDTATSAGDDLHVTVGDFDNNEHPFGPVAWQPVASDDGPVLPVEGDWALVIRSDQGRWCVLLWTPSPS